MRSNRILKHYSAAFLSALLLFSASPGRWAIAPIMWIALIPLIRCCLSREISTKAAAKLGFFCGLLYNTALLYWIVIALGRYGGLPLVVSVLAMLGLAAYMALYFACFTATLSATKKLVPPIFSAPVIWVGLDQLRAWLFTGFPWQDLGYSQFQSSILIQIADITGHSGITFLLVMINTLAATTLIKIKKQSSSQHYLIGQIPQAVFAFSLIIGTVVYGQYIIGEISQSIDQVPTLTTAVMQGNFDQNEKWSTDGQEKTVQTYLELTTQAATGRNLDLAIWPETALPFFPDENSIIDTIKEFSALPDSPEILTGAPHYTLPTFGSINYFNSAFLITGYNHNAMQRYDKQQLVPFGEYIPLQKILGILPIASTMGNFTSGQSSSPILCKKAKLGILICFESIFPDLARKRTDAGADILVNLTNDAWYGVSSAPYQQMSMAVLRAVENRRSLARSANTGISSFIDPLGRIIEQSPIFEQLFLVQDLPILNRRSIFNRFGFIFQPACFLLLSLIILYAIIVKRRK